MYENVIKSYNILRVRIKNIHILHHAFTIQLVFFRLIYKICNICMYVHKTILIMITFQRKSCTEFKILNVVIP